jgi:hypothetical protein
MIKKNKANLIFAFKYILSSRIPIKKNKKENKIKIINSCR